MIKVLEPVSVPMERSKPRRSLMLIAFTFLGGFIGVSVIFGKFIWVNISQKISNSNITH